MHPGLAILLVFAFIFSGLYAGLLRFLIVRWRSPPITGGSRLSRQPSISVLVVGRNEASNIIPCLESISRQEYPSTKFEILYVDDHSQDETLKCAGSLDIPNLSIIDLSKYDLSRFGHAYKKAGQFVGVSQAKFDYIACTDADCLVSETWLKSMAEALEGQEAALVTGLVDILNNGSVLNLFQYIDVRGTMAFTKAGLSTGYFHLANGANMVFDKQAYLEYSQEAQYHLASGDDVFLANWLVRHGMKVSFNDDPGGAVQTLAEHSWSGLFEQRLRWSTKTRAYAGPALWIILGGLFGFNLLFLACLAGGILVDPTLLAGAALMFVVKMTMDGYLIRTMNKTWNPQASVNWRWPVLIMLHFFYLVLIGVMGLSRKRFRWKDRKVS